MFGKRIRLFKLLNFEIHIDPSWIIIALLVAWSLSTGFFPFHFKGLSVGTYWLMGAVGVIGLFFSIILHELAHSVVATKQGMPMHGITLFIFGGVAEMGEEPSGPKAEFLMAIVGPLTSFAIALVFYVLQVGAEALLPLAVMGVVSYLAFINAVLGAFNLIPAFPLDGGRVLRSIFWRIKGDLRWATRIASGVGVFFGFLLIAYGFFSMFRADLFGGMWMVLIGVFVNSAAKMSYQQLLIRQMLEGEPVKRFMRTGPVSVSPSESVEQMVENYIYPRNLKMLPVTNSGKLEGCVFAQQVRDVPRDKWPDKTVGELAGPCPEESVIDSRADASELLSRTTRTGATRFIVVDGDRVVGSVSVKDIINHVSMKMELEQRE